MKFDHFRLLVDMMFTPDGEGGAMQRYDGVDVQRLNPLVLAYVGDADEVVVYIDISQYWSSGYDAEALLGRIAAGTDYKTAVPLFETGLSTTYLISR